MTDYSDAQAHVLGGLLVSVLRSWCDAKSTEADLPHLLADAKEEVRQGLLITIEGLQRELMLATGKVDSQKVFIKGCEAKIENLTKRVIELSPFPERLLTAEAEIESLKKRVAGLESTIAHMKAEYAALDDMHSQALRDILMHEERATHLNAAVQLEAAKALEFETHFYAGGSTHTHGILLYMLNIYRYYAHANIFIIRLLLYTHINPSILPCVYLLYVSLPL